MAVVGRDEADGAVQVLVVVPMHEFADPIDSLLERVEAQASGAGAVLECSKDRLGEGVVVADVGPAEMRGRFQGTASCRAWRSPSSACRCRSAAPCRRGRRRGRRRWPRATEKRTRRTTRRARPCRRPWAPDVEEQAEVVEAAAHGRGQVGDVPAQQLAGPGADAWLSTRCQTPI